MVVTNFPFLIMFITFIATKKSLQVDPLTFKRSILNTYFHCYKISTKSANSFSSPRKSVKVISDAHYCDKSSDWQGQSTNV